MKRSPLFLVLYLVVHVCAFGCDAQSGSSTSALPPQPPPLPGCPPCVGEVPVAACPSVDAIALEYRCNAEMDRQCPVLGGEAHLHLVRAGCWDGTCGGLAPPPWALHVGDSPCLAGSTTNEVQLYCW